MGDIQGIPTSSYALQSRSYLTFFLPLSCFPLEKTETTVPSYFYSITILRLHISI